MSRIFAHYVEKARNILLENRRGPSTVPSSTLYPHQWNWDSGFIAIGLSHFDTPGAMAEMESLFSAQWSNGMLPSIIFDPRSLGHYFPEPDFWRAEDSGLVPPGKLTSGITMPPIHAVAAESIYANARRKKAVIPFLKRIFPRILALHAYLYRERDPGGEGLVYIRHPWESGIDNSPTWDAPLGRINPGTDEIPPYTRKDLESGVDPSMRPGDEDYDRYVYLVDLFRNCGYDESLIREKSPFLIQDPLFNSILCRANESLARIAGIIGEPAEEINGWAEKTAGAIREKLWDEEHGIFDAYDLAADGIIEVDTAAGFLPLFAGAATREQAEILYRRLDSSSFCALHQGNCFTIPNYDTTKEDFDRSNYWRGPIWININWMLTRGLHRYGYTLKADSLRKDLLQLPIRFGFHEYFDSFDGTGYGSAGFSWTAALFIDLVEEFYRLERPPVGILDRGKAFFSGGRVLNGGEEEPACTVEELSGLLMKSIRDLREKFYDTDRGQVDYDRLKGSPEFAEYRLLTHGLRNYDLSKLAGRRAKLAFWVNLYNTIVVDAIVSLGVRNSVKEVPEFFSRVRYAIGPHLFSPDDIEQGILRGNVRRRFPPLKQFGPGDPRRRHVLDPTDPRIHFALVCGSRSCAPIEFYEAGRIDEQLEEAARSFINSSEVIVLPEEKKVLLSMIFRWYEDDFGGRQGVADLLYDHLADDGARRFLRESAGDWTFEYLHYDWNLNR